MSKEFDYNKLQQAVGLVTSLYQLGSMQDPNNSNFANYLKYGSMGIVGIAALPGVYDQLKEGIIKLSTIPKDLKNTIYGNKANSVTFSPLRNVRPAYPQLSPDGTIPTNSYYQQLQSYGNSQEQYYQQYPSADYQELSSDYQQFPSSDYKQFPSSDYQQLAQ